MSEYEFTDSTGTIGKLTGELKALGGATGDVPTQQADGFLAQAAGGGGSMPFKIVRVTFDHATAGINDGVPCYTPEIGETLLSLTVKRYTAWNGTTPKLDIAQAPWWVTNPTYGWFGSLAGPVDMTDVLYDGGGVLTANNGTIASLEGSMATAQMESIPITPPTPGYGWYFVGSEFTTVDPVLVVVSQDGAKGGAATGATTGSSAVELLIQAAP